MNSITNYPSEEECFKIIEQHKMLPNIIAHSIQVKNVALEIYERLIDQSSIDRNILIASALLHDIAKTKSIKENIKHHDMLGGEILREIGFIQISKIVENHVVFRDFLEDTAVNEKDIIYYSDKRVKHDKIVSVNERVNDIAERYGHSEEHKKQILDNKEFILRVEKKIERFTSSRINLIGE